MVNRGVTNVKLSIFLIEKSLTALVGAARLREQ
jgi:hypothetical protein